MTTIYFSALILFVFVTCLLCFVIMIQESKSSGLGSVFGGGGGEQSLFGTSTAEVLQTFTTWLVAVFMSFCIILSLWTSALGRAATYAPSKPPLHEQQTQ